MYQRVSGGNYRSRLLNVLAAKASGPTVHARSPATSSPPAAHHRAQRRSGRAGNFSGTEQPEPKHTRLIDGIDQQQQRERPRSDSRREERQQADRNQIHAHDQERPHDNRDCQRPATVTDAHPDGQSGRETGGQQQRGHGKQAEVLPCISRSRERADHDASGAESDE
jgi:hypothetical protein